MPTRNYTEAIGRTRRKTIWLDPESIDRMTDLFDLPRGSMSGTVPVPWHWVYFFSESVANSRIGRDGHPARGDFLPAIRLERRMFAGSQIEMSAELQTSREATFLERIDAIEEKSGASGPLLFVTIQCSIEQNGAEVGAEKRTLVYLDPPGPVAMPKVQPFVPPEHGEIACEWRPQTQELFRYSALTYNGHRIHYDADYARDVERYPGVVVHGPLTATRLALLAARMAGGSVTWFSFRGKAPVFVDQPIQLIGRREENRTIALRAIRCDGTLAMEATARTGYASASVRPPI
jgi:3-methylfumaryl-CoA hydratase